MPSATLSPASSMWMDQGCHPLYLRRHAGTAAGRGPLVPVPIPPTALLHRYRCHLVLYRSSRSPPLLLLLLSCLICSLVFFVSFLFSYLLFFLVCRSKRQSHSFSLTPLSLTPTYLDNSRPQPCFLFLFLYCLLHCYRLESIFIHHEVYLRLGRCGHL